MTDNSHTDNIQLQRQHHRSSSDAALPPEPPSALGKVLPAILKELRAVIREEIAQVQDQVQEPEPLLDVGAVARRLSVSKRTVETIIAEGKLRPLWVRGSRRFTSEAVEAYIREQARKTRR